MGMSGAVTALPLLVLLMKTLEILRQSLGQRILRYARLDDIAIWGVLALILRDWTRVGRQGLFLLACAGATWGLRALMRRLPERDRCFVSLIWHAVASFGADGSGPHFCH
jgi:Kef-type K+ transport system membrane component KefB